MRKIIALIFLSVCSVGFASNETDDLSRAYTLMLNDREAAKNLLIELKKEYSNSKSSIWNVRSNFYLAYITRIDEEFGESVIYYLEAIRYSENATYEGIEAERISLYKNLANIFQQFKAFDLATEYNLEGIKLAQRANKIQEINSLKFNQARNLRLSKDYKKAIDLILSMIPNLSIDETPKVLNELGITYTLDENWNKAQSTFVEIINLDYSPVIYKAKSFHNLGEIFYKTGKINLAIENLKKSIAVKESIQNKDLRSLFISHKTAGEYLLELKDLKSAEFHLEKAEDLISKVSNSMDYLNLYELLSQLNYQLNDLDKARHYGSLYSLKVNDYIQLQNEVQEINKSYNLNLITKRYFDEVAKQEKIASILFYSRLISGSLLVLLLSVIAYNRYEKLRIRKSIEKQLLQLEILD